MSDLAVRHLEFTTDVGPLPRIALICVVAGCLVHAPDVTEACSCAGATDAELFARADAVFVGRVEAVDIPWRVRQARERRYPERLSSFLLTLGDPEVVTTFAVERVFKGRLGERVRVESGTGACCNCSLGATFESAPRWLVYATAHEGRWSTGLCSRPRPVPPGDMLVPGAPLGSPPSLGAAAPSKTSTRSAARDGAPPG